MSCESSAYFANEVLLTLPTKYYFFVDAVLLLQKYQPPMSFPDFTRHFFSLLAETVDSVTRAILIHYTQSRKLCCFSRHSIPAGHAESRLLCLALQRYAFFVMFNLLFVINLIFPHFLLHSLFHVCLRGHLVADAHVRTMVIIEMYEPWDEVLRILKCGKLLLRINCLFLISLDTFSLY